MVLPVIVLVLLMTYFPMYGIQTAFRNHDIFTGICDSRRIGLIHLKDFFSTESCR